MNLKPRTAISAALIVASAVSTVVSACADLAPCWAAACAAAVLSVFILAGGDDE